MIIIIVNSLRSRWNISSPLILANWAVTFASFYVNPLYSSSSILKLLQHRVLPYPLISLTTWKHLSLKHCPDFSLLRHTQFLTNLATGISRAVNRCHSLFPMLVQSRALSTCTSTSPLLSTVTTLVSVFCNIKRRFYARCLLAYHSTPNLDSQGITLFLASTLQSARRGWPYMDYKTPADIYRF